LKNDTGHSKYYDTISYAELRFPSLEGLGVGYSLECPQGLSKVLGWVFETLLKIKHMKLSISILLILFVFPAFSQILTVEISGIKTDKGSIQLSVYLDNKTFVDETPFRIYNFNKGEMVDGKLTVIISDLKPGTYGIAMIDDKNENGKMDFRLFIPIEGFGFSNYYFKGSRKPDFSNFAFPFSDNNTTISIVVQHF